MQDVEVSIHVKVYPPEGARGNPVTATYKAATFDTPTKAFKRAKKLLRKLEHAVEDAPS